MAFLNLGILAHVDAGKTSLTERILFETGVIKAPGRVDDGNTQTDTLAQERARGITIKSAVVSFDLGDLTVNLIDTPGHADFVAEVQRSLTVLDAVVLVISAVEGIQPQTRKLAKAVWSRGIPLVIFINKIDRIGARFDQILADIRTHLGLNILPFAHPTLLESDRADVEPVDQSDPSWQAALALQLADLNDEFMDHWLASDGQPDLASTRSELQRQIGAGILSPVFVGAATRGIGVSELLNGVAELIPVFPQDTTGPLEATVFKIEQTQSRERLVIARINRGTLQNRAVVQIATPGNDTSTAERIKGVDRFRHGTCSPVQEASAGEIVRLHGLSAARIGDRLGTSESDTRLHFEIAQPRLESVISPIDPAQRNQLNLALQTIADADPLINLQQNDLSGELSVRLFGEIQQEVILETLSTDFGVRACFGEPAAICIERPIGSGAFVMHMGEPGNPFVGTVGISLEAGPVESGIQYQFEPGSLPPAYYRVIEEAVYATLAEGLYGWQVRDCMVTLTHVAYSSPVSTGTDFRRLTPMVVMQALEQAGVQVCQPVEALEVVTPAEALGDVMHVLITNGTALEDTVLAGKLATVTGTIPTINVHAIERRIYGLGRGITSITTEFLRYDPVAGELPTRARRTVNALNREEYIGAVSAGKVVLT